MGLVSGEDCTIMSSGDRGLQSCRVVWRMVLKRARSELTVAVVATVADMLFSLCEEIANTGWMSC